VSTIDIDLFFGRHLEYAEAQAGSGGAGCRDPASLLPVSPFFGCSGIAMTADRFHGSDRRSEIYESVRGARVVSNRRQTMLAASLDDIIRSKRAAGGEGSGCD